MSRQALIVGLSYLRLRPKKLHLAAGIRDGLHFRWGLIEQLGFNHQNTNAVTDFRGPTNHLEILKHLRAMIATSKNGDALTFYFSGHGKIDRSKPKLVCGRLSNGRLSLLGAGAMVRTMRLLPEGVSLTLYIDSCYSGSLFSYCKLQLPKSVVVFTSTNGLTPAYAYKGFTTNWNGWFSVFTYVLLKVMKSNKELSNLGLLKVSHHMVRDYVGQMGAQWLKSGELENLVEVMINNRPALICSSEKLHSSVFGSESNNSVMENEAEIETLTGLASRSQH